MARYDSSTYVVLIPHDEEERIEWEVIVSTAEAGKSSEDATSKEHSVQVLLSIGQQLFHLLLLLRVHLLIFI